MFEIVLKRAWPCSSRLVPVGAPIGFSGALSSVGARVFSAQSFSDAWDDGLQRRQKSGFRLTVLRRSAFGLLSGIQFPLCSTFDDRGVLAMLQKGANRPSGWLNVKIKVKIFTTGDTENTGETAGCLTSAFRRTYAGFSFGGGNLKAFRRLLQRTPVYGAYKALGHYPDYWYWILRGRPSRSPHLLKQKVVREYGENFRLKTLVETGTYYGEMVAAMKSRFRPHLFHRIRSGTRGAGHTQIRARRTHANFLRR